MRYKRKPYKYKTTENNSKPKLSFKDCIRTFLIVSFIMLSMLSMVGAFALAWMQLDGVNVFLLASLFLAVWASVTATCTKITVKDVCGVVRAVLGRSSEPENTA